MKTQIAFQVSTFLIVSLYIVSGDSALRLNNLFCMPRPTVVPTDPRYYPYFVSLHRCNGSCGTSSPALIECVADKTETVLMTVRNGPMWKAVALTNHTSCKRMCVHKKEDCPYPNTYNEEDCRCRCQHKSPPNGISCGPLKSWSTTSCGCVCNQMNRSCSNRKYYFDTKTCSCQCKPQRKKNCEESGGTFIQEKCRCKKLQRQISGNNAVDGKFVGSTTFWIYILIGEFIVLVICFDGILYCKQLGLMYRITRKCRQERLILGKAEERTLTEEKFHPKKGVHLNEGCSTLSSQASIPELLVL